MSQHKNIAPSFQVLADMGSFASQQKVAQQSQSLYNFYKSQSYTCNIESMGNAMIQPTMYFNLRHVPMFTGPYLIINVSHNITSKDFTTQFEGIRIPKHALDVPDKLVMSINRELLTSIQERLERERVNTSSGGDVTDEVANGKEKKVSESQCEESNQYPDKEFIEPFTYNVTKKQVFDYLSLQGISTNLEMYLFVLANLNMEDGVAKTFEKNLYKIRTDNNQYITQNNVSLINKQYCVNYENVGNVPMASFKEYEDAIEFMIRKYQGPLSVILDELVEAEYANGEQTVSKWANALTKFWCNVTGKVEGSNQIDINYNVSTKLVSDSGFKNEYDKVKVSFENGINSSLF
jgi:predicted DNA-binding ArsR family transcriptional regulator